MGKFLMSERQKYNHNNGLPVNYYFWRTTTQQEIDYIEEAEGKLHAYEFRWKDKKVRIQDSFLNAYPGTVASVITTENYNSFLGAE
jgi:hypothetical protein